MATALFGLVVDPVHCASFTVIVYGVWRNLRSVIVSFLFLVKLMIMVHGMYYSPYVLGDLNRLVIFFLEEK